MEKEIKYTTKKEAEAAAAEINRKTNIIFCPLIKDVCKNGQIESFNAICVCWDDARVFQSSGGYYLVTDRGCGNAMFYETQVYVNI